MNKIQTLTIDSREVAEMVGKEHFILLRDIKRYIGYMDENNKLKIESVEFFRESTYLSEQNKSLPCYDVTKKGCELIAHKLTGKKGVLFTANYINRFHEMEEELKNPKPKMPWFIRKFRGKYVILERDFISITGVDITKHKLFYRMEYFKGGKDWNGYGWYTVIDKEKFKEEFGFDYGNDKCMLYLFPSGVIKALEILIQDKSIRMNDNAVEIIINGLKSIDSLGYLNYSIFEKRPKYTQQDLIGNYKF